MPWVIPKTGAKGKVRPTYFRRRYQLVLVAPILDLRKKTILSPSAYFHQTVVW